MIHYLKFVRAEHVMMLLRGIIWQSVNFRFGFLLLLDSGSRVRVPRSVAITGLVKIGRHATLDLRNVTSGAIRSGFSLGDFSIARASGSKANICPRFELGHNVTFGPYCNIGGGFGLEIGDNLIAGPYVSIHPESHAINQKEPIRYQPIKGTGIRIGDDCWFGAKATVLDGANVSKGTVLAAGAVMPGTQTRPYSVHGGVPAKEITKRSVDNEFD